MLVEMPKSTPSLFRKALILLLLVVAIAIAFNISSNSTGPVVEPTRVANVCPTTPAEAAELSLQHNTSGRMVFPVNGAETIRLDRVTFYLFVNGVCYPGRFELLFVPRFHPTEVAGEPDNINFELIAAYVIPELGPEETPSEAVSTSRYIPTWGRELSSGDNVELVLRSAMRFTIYHAYDINGSIVSGPFEVSLPAGKHLIYPGYRPVD